MDEITIKPAPNPAKLFLRRYGALISRQESIQRAINAAYDRALSCTARPKPIPVSGGSAAYDRMAEDVAKIADETEVLRETLGDVSAALSDVLRAIEAVPDEMQKTVLTLRYVEGLDWLSVSEKIGYEISYTHIMHGRALWNVKKWMEREGILPEKCV